MKYITVINNLVASTHFPTLDMKDLAILNWLADFAHTGQMEMKIHDRKPYYWVKYSKVLDDLPPLKWRTEDRVYRSCKKMAKLNILIAHPDNVKERESFYGFGPKYVLFISSQNPGEKTGLTPVKKPGLPRRKNRADNTIKYNKIIDTLKSKNVSEEMVDLLATRLLKSKLGDQAADVIEVFDHFNETHGRDVKYTTGAYLDYVIKRLQDEFTLEQIKLVIDYKRYYFTDVTNSPDHMNLDTYLRDTKFEANLEKALTWRRQSEGTLSIEEFTRDHWEKHPSEAYRKFMEWYWKAEVLHAYPISAPELEAFLNAGRLPGVDLETHVRARKRLLVQIINGIVAGDNLPYGRTMIEHVFKLSTYKTNKT